MADSSSNGNTDGSARGRGAHSGGHRGNKNRGNRGNHKGPNHINNNSSNTNNNGGQRGGGTSFRGGRGRDTDEAKAIRVTKVNMKLYEKMNSEIAKNFEDIKCESPTDECVICCKTSDVFGIGSCRHPVCIECVIRIRVINECKGCPVCRTDIDVISLVRVSEDLSTFSIPAKSHGHPDEARYGVRFSSDYVGVKYEKYLAHVCKICKGQDGERLEFASFISLRQHMSSAHDLTYCHICVDNLSQFSRERKTYNRESLQRHIRIGDKDDQSFKGHPKCLICEDKFFDEEARYKHLRKEHLYCQVCEKNGMELTNVFYKDNSELRAHYNEAHFPCTNPNCTGIAYATKFELDMHMASEHNEKRNLLDFSSGPNRRDYDSRPPPGARRQPEQRPLPQQTGRIAVVQMENQIQNPQSDPSQFTVTRSAQSKSVNLCFGKGPGSSFSNSAADFPSLGPAAAPSSSSVPTSSKVDYAKKANEFPRLNKVNKVQQPPKSSGEEFPSLGGSSAPPTSSMLRVPASKAVMRKPPTPVKTVKPAPVKQQPVKSAKQQSSRPPREDDEENAFLNDYVPTSLMGMQSHSQAPTIKTFVPVREEIKVNNPSRPPKAEEFPSLGGGAPVSLGGSSMWSKPNSVKKPIVVAPPKPQPPVEKPKPKQKAVPLPSSLADMSFKKPEPVKQLPEKEKTSGDEWEDAPIKNLQKFKKEQRKMERKAKKAQGKSADTSTVSMEDKKEEEEEEEKEEEQEVAPPPALKKKQQQQQPKKAEEAFPPRISPTAEIKILKEHHSNLTGMLQEQLSGLIASTSNNLFSTLNSFGSSLFSSAAPTPAQTPSLDVPPGFENFVPKKKSDGPTSFANATFLTKEDVEAKKPKAKAEEKPDEDGWVTKKPVAGKKKNKK